MCAALTAERVQTEASAGADRSAGDVACDSHALSTAVQRGSRSGAAAEKCHGRQAGRRAPPQQTLQANSGDVQHLFTSGFTSRLNAARVFSFFVYLVDAMWDDSSEGMKEAACDLA